MQPQPSASPPSRQTTITTQTLWQGAAIVVALLILGFVVINAFAVLLVIFTAIVLADGLRPLVTWLTRRHIPRPLAVLLLYVVLLALVGGVGWLLLRPVITQIATLTDDLPHYSQRAQDLFAQLQQTIAASPDLERLFTSLQSQLGTSLSQTIPFLVRVPVSIFSLVFNLIMVLTIAFFWLTTTDRLLPFVLSLLPPTAQPTGAAVIDEIGRKMGGYVRGVGIDMVVIGIASGIGVWLLGVPYALLLALFAGLTEAIPFVGPLLGGAAAAAVALIAASPVTALEVIALYIVIQQLEGSLLVPFVMNRVVDLNPLVILLAVLLGGTLFGIIGALLAVPLAVIVQVLVVRVLAPTLQKTFATREMETSTSP